MYLHDKILLGRQTRVAVLDLKQRIVDNTIIVCMPYASLKGVNNKNLQKYFANISKPRNELEKLSANVDLNCLLGIINSKLIKYFCDNLTQQGIDMFPDDWKKIPIPIINERNRELGKNICTSVEQIHKSLIQHENAKTDQDKSYYENKCASLDRQIDESVYKLYGLTDEEIGIVEENTKRSA
jgi:hypothetical protein